MDKKQLKKLKQEVLQVLMLNGISPIVIANVTKRFDKFLKEERQVRG